MNIVEIDINNLLKVGMDVTLYIYLQLLYEGNYEVAEKYWNYVYSEEERLDMIEHDVWFRRIGGNSIIRPETIKLFGGARETVESWIQSYRNLFPPRYKGDRIGCIKKMKKYLLERKHTKDVILRATAQYIKERKKYNFKYTKQADYFIEKENVSFLGNYCERILEGERFQDSDESIYQATKLI